MLSSLALAAFTALAPVSPSGDWEFDGQFSDVRRSSEPACAELFSAVDYHAKHALAGPSWRTSVLRLDLAESEGEGFFDGVVFVGLLGGSNDLYYEKSLERDGITYNVLAEGFVDREVLYLEVKVDAERDGTALCDAGATFSAFN